MIPGFTAAASLADRGRLYPPRFRWTRATVSTPAAIGAASSFHTGSSATVTPPRASLASIPAHADVPCSYTITTYKSQEIYDKCMGACENPPPWLQPLCLSNLGSAVKCAAERTGRAAQYTNPDFQCAILNYPQDTCIYSNPQGDGFCCPKDRVCGTECCDYPQTACCGSPPTCVDLTSNISHCGDCLTSCGQDQSCIDGKCACQTPCRDGWEQNLVTCDCSCPQGRVTCAADCCPDGFGCCGSQCTPLNTPANCGACGKQCPAAGMICQNGQCVCDPSTPDLCNEKCVNLAKDPENCGVCGLTCLPGQSCEAGVCTCPTDRSLLCKNQCVDPKTDNSNCGSCAHPCWQGQDCSYDPQTGQPISCTNYATSCVGGFCTCPAGRSACAPNYCAQDNWTCCYETLGIPASCPPGTACVPDPSSPLGFSCS
jgi:hypothetical protein